MAVVVLTQLWCRTGDQTCPAVGHDAYEDDSNPRQIYVQNLDGQHSAVVISSINVVGNVPSSCQYQLYTFYTQICATLSVCVFDIDILQYIVMYPIYNLL